MLRGGLFLLLLAVFSFACMRAWATTEAPLNLTAPGQRKAFPVTQGIPIPKGLLKSTDNVKLVNERGKEVPLQVEALAKAGWVDGSIKWLLLDFQADLPKSGKTTYRLLLGDGVSRSPIKNGLKWEETRDKIICHTGPLKFSVRKDKFSFLSEVWLEGEKIVDGGGDIFIDLGQGKNVKEGRQLRKEVGAPPLPPPPKYKDSYGYDDIKTKKIDVPYVNRFDYESDIELKNLERYRASLDKDSLRVTLEKRGPLHGIICIKGWHIAPSGRKYSPYTLRIHAYAGKSYLKVEHTFVNTEDPRKWFVKSIGIEIPLAFAEKPRFVLGGETRALEGSGDVYLVQDKWMHYRVAGALSAEGKQAPGWMDITGSLAGSEETMGLAVGIRDMAEKFPKELALSGNKVLIYVWPKDEIGVMDLRLEHQKYKPYYKFMLDNYPQFVAISREYDSPHKYFEGDWDKEVRGLGVSNTTQVCYYFHKGDFISAEAPLVAESFDEPILAFIPGKWNSDSNVLGRIHYRDRKRFPRIERYIDNRMNFLIRHQREWSRWVGMFDYGDVETFPARPQFFFAGRWGWMNNEIATVHYALLHFMHTGDREWWKFAESLAQHYIDVDTIEYGPGKGRETSHHVEHWGTEPGGGGHWFASGVVQYYFLSGSMRALDIAHLIADSLPEEPRYSAYRSGTNYFWGAVRFWELTSDPKYKKFADDFFAFLKRTQRPDGTWEKGHTAYLDPGLYLYYLATENPEAKGVIKRYAEALYNEKAGGRSPRGLAMFYHILKDRKYVEKAVRLHFRDRSKGYFKIEKLTPTSIDNARFYHGLDAILYLEAALCEEGLSEDIFLGK